MKIEYKNKEKEYIMAHRLSPGDVFQPRHDNCIFIFCRVGAYNSNCINAITNEFVAIDNNRQVRKLNAALVIYE